SSRRRHTRFSRDWSSDVCSSDLVFNATLRLTSTRRQQVSQMHNLITAKLELSHRRRRDLSSLTNLKLTSSSQVKSACQATAHDRSEERRVGKESRSRWCPAQHKR